MASNAEAITTVATGTHFPQTVKTRLVQIAGAARRWAKQGQLGSSSMTEMGRHSGARI